MNWDRIEGNWMQFRGTVMHRWGVVTRSEQNITAGKRVQMAGKVQRNYGVARDGANRQLCAWQKLQKAISSPESKSARRSTT